MLACRFGDFLANNEREAKLLLKTPELTLSVWDYLFDPSLDEEFLNPDYVENSKLIKPQTSTSHFQSSPSQVSHISPFADPFLAWSAFYERYRLSMLPTHEYVESTKKAKTVRFRSYPFHFSWGDDEILTRQEVYETLSVSLITFGGKLSPLLPYPSFVSRALANRILQGQKHEVEALSQENKELKDRLEGAESLLKDLLQKDPSLLKLVQEKLGKHKAGSELPEISFNILRNADGTVSAQLSQLFLRPF